MIKYILYIAIIFAAIKIGWYIAREPGPEFEEKNDDE
jgi:hypothetical protein